MNGLSGASLVLVYLACILSLGLLGRMVAQKFNQSAVLGELLLGIIAGNLLYFLGFSDITILREALSLPDIINHILAGSSYQHAISMHITDPLAIHNLSAILSSKNAYDFINLSAVISNFAEYGVVFLLFSIGLESSISDFKHTGRDAMQVALLGVIAPVVLGFLSLTLLAPHIGAGSAFFIAASLSATSIGISARVFKDLQLQNSPVAKIILGAAVIDDVLGLFLLAIASQIALHHKIDLPSLCKIIIATTGFFAVSIILASKIHLIFKERWSQEVKIITSLIIMMFLAALASVVGLAAIVGAFIAGLLLPGSIKKLIDPFVTLFAPVFFLLIGMQVKLETFYHLPTIMLATLLISVAIVGKLISGMLIRASKVDKLLVGIGMLPRGEVGLIFAYLGKSSGVLTNEFFTAIVIMVMVTTLMTPILLQMRLQKQ
jgi:Kef-type K+ transport system membrane component KefB